MHLVLISISALVLQTAFVLFDVRIDTELFPLFRDHFTHLCGLQKAYKGLDLEA